MATKTHVVKTEEGQVEKAVQIRSTDPGAPVSNQTWINTTDKKMKFYDGADIQNVGAAGVGSASTFALFQAEDGDISSFTNMAVESASPIAGDKSYSVSSLPAAAPAVTVDERRDGAFCVMSLISKMTSGSGRIVVKDNSSNELVSQVVSSTSAEKVSMSFSIPSGATSIQVHFEDSATPVGWIVDDIEFSDNPFAKINIQEENVYTAVIENNGTASVISENVTGWIDSVSRLSPGIVSVDWTSLGLTEIPAVIATNNGSGSASRYCSVSDVTTTGCSVLVYADNGGLFDRGFSISLQFQGQDYKPLSENLITNAQGIENEYSTVIDGSAGAGTVIASESKSGIFTVSRTGTGQYTVGYSALGLSQAPSIVGSVVDSNSFNLSITSITSSQCTVNIRNTNSDADTDRDFSLQLQLQGSDYKNPNAYSVTPIDKFESKPFVTGTTTFNNLTVGKIYHLTGTLLYNTLAAGAPSLVTVTVSGAIGTTRTMKEQTSVSGTLEVADHTLSPNYKFKATSTSLSIALTTLSGLSAAGSNTVELTECNSCEEVSGVF